MERAYDLAVVGGGIVGLAHAWHGLRRGWRVLLLERGPRAEDASIRNFGMVWPIGQPAGPRLELALRSRGHWLEVLEACGAWYRAEGSIHVAREEDELAVLEELAAQGSHEVELLTAAETVARSSAVVPYGLRGGLYSPTEVGVDPPGVIARLAAWLGERGVDVRFEHPVHAVAGGRVVTPRGELRAERVVVCSGADTATLYPERFEGAGLFRCKLQMMATVPQPEYFELGPMLAAGLTLPHCESFRGCPSLPALQERLARAHPAHVAYGIHVMVSQNEAGELVFGASHEYDVDISPFDRTEIDELVTDYLSGFFAAPVPVLASRWHGLYLENPAGHVWRDEPEPGVRLVTGLAGAGMTLSFGIADETLEGW